MNPGATRRRGVGNSAGSGSSIEPGQVQHRCNPPSGRVSNYDWAENMQPLIYVSGPYTAPTSDELAQNIKRAKLTGLKVRAVGFVPIVPHLAILNDDPRVFTYDKAMNECLEILGRCDAILMMDGWQESRGACIEHEAAIFAGIPVCYDVSDLCLPGGPKTSGKEQVQ